MPTGSCKITVGTAAAIAAAAAHERCVPTSRRSRRKRKRKRNDSDGEKRFFRLRRRLVGLARAFPGVSATQRAYYVPRAQRRSGATRFLESARRQARRKEDAGEGARLLATVHANPAIFSNNCYSVIVENCRLQHGVEFDQGEDLITRLVPVADIPRLVAAEKIKHPLVVAALYHFELWQRGLKK